jgi:hypothetical protein
MSKKPGKKHRNNMGTRESILKKIKNSLKGTDRYKI